MFIHRLLFVFIFIFTSFAVPVCASTGTHVNLDSVHVGIRGYYKLGLWTPVFISWSGGGAKQVEEIEFHSVDSDGTPICTKLSIVSEPSSVLQKEDGGFEAILYGKIGRIAREITIRLRGQVKQADQDTQKSVVLAERTIRPEYSEFRGAARKEQVRQDVQNVFLSPVPQERPILLIFGENDGGLQDAIGLMRLKDNRRPVLVLVDSLDQLPRDRLGLEAVEHIFLTTSIPAIWEGTNAKDSRIVALHEWLKWGGKVLFAPGKASEPFLADADAPLTAFLPGRFERMAVLRQGKPIELYANSTRSILMDGSEVAPFISLPFLVEPQGTVELAEADLPLIIHTLVGFGTLTFFGGDLTSEPMSDWRDRGPLLLKLLNWSESKSQSAATQSLIHIGFQDVSGQMRSALDHFEGIRPIPFSLILVLLVVYVFLIGPGDWFLVHKVLKRPYLTWITFPLWLVLFCWISLFWGASHRVHPLAINSAELIDLKPSEQMLRVSTWGGVFSPQDANYDISLSHEFLDDKFLSNETRSSKNAPGIESEITTEDDANAAENVETSDNWKFQAFRNNFHWLGLSGSGLGGMEPKTVELNTWDTSYEYQGPESDRMQKVPMRVRSTKSFFGQTTFEPNSSASSVLRNAFRDTKLKYHNGILVGSITNDLPVPLEHCFLVFGPWAMRIGRLEPGQKFEVGTGTMRRELKMLANSTAAGIGEEQSVLAGRQLNFYNTQSKDAWPILRTLSFFQAFGGFDTIGLHNSLHSNLDWSPVLTTDHVIFIATVAPDSNFSVERIKIHPSRTGTESSNGEQPQIIEQHTTVLRAIFPMEK